MRWFVHNLSGGAVAVLQPGPALLQGASALLFGALVLSSYAQEDANAEKIRPTDSGRQRTSGDASRQTPEQGASEASPAAKGGKENGVEWGARLQTGTGETSATQKPPRNAADAGVPEKQTPMNIPLVEGSPGLFLRIPDLDAEGKLRSLFMIGEVSKVDDRTVEIKDSFFETYRDDLSRDFSIDLPKAHLDVYSKVLTAKVPVTIWRQEFELRGATMEFNTSTREGGLGGPVEMIIYNGFGGSSEPAPPSSKPSSSSSVPPHPENPASQPPKSRR